MNEIIYPLHYFDCWIAVCLIYPIQCKLYSYLVPFCFVLFFLIFIYLFIFILLNLIHFSLHLSCVTTL